MKTARVKVIDSAKALCIELGIDFVSDDATKIIDAMEIERKKQDRDTRHACAEAILQCESPGADLVSIDIAHNVCMNVKAV
jgi:hypothetical protein